MDVVAVVRRLGEPQGGVVTAAQLTAAGVRRTPLRTAVRHGRVLRRGVGVYALPTEPPPEADLHLLTRQLKAVVSHETAASWWGFDLAHDPEPLHQLTVPRDRHREALSMPGARLHRADLAASARVTRDALAVTSPLQTVLDLSRSLEIADAVAVADSALRARRVDLDGLETAAARLKGPGSAAVRRVASLVDPAAESVLESRLRVLLIGAGLAPAASQHTVALDDRFFGRVDLAWPGLRVAVEADGFAFHADRASYRNDRRRLSRLAAIGWWVLRVSWEDVVLEPDSVVELVRESLTTACAVLGQPFPTETWTPADSAPAGRDRAA